MPQFFYKTCYYTFAVGGDSDGIGSDETMGDFAKRRRFNMPDSAHTSGVGDDGKVTSVGLQTDVGGCTDFHSSDWDSAVNAPVSLIRPDPEERPVESLREIDLVDETAISEVERTKPAEGAGKLAHCPPLAYAHILLVAGLIAEICYRNPSNPGVNVLPEVEKPCPLAGGLFSQLDPANPALDSGGVQAQHHCRGQNWGAEHT